MAWHKFFDTLAIVFCIGCLVGVAMGALIVRV